MDKKIGYPAGTEEWKINAVEWLFVEGLLSADYWKERVEEPLPLWAQATVYNRLFQKLKGEIRNNGKNI